MASLKYSITTVRNDEIQKITIEGSNYVWTGLAVGIVSGENNGESIGKGATIGGAIGAGIGGASSYESAKEKVRDDLADKRLSNKAILPGQIAYGILFFPGAPEEAKGAKELRLYLNIGAVGQVVTLPL